MGASKLEMSSTRKDTDLLTPMRSFWRGKFSGSDPLNVSNRAVEQSAEIIYGCIGSSVEQSECIGAPLPVTGDLNHTEQKGRYEVVMEAAPRGNNEVRKNSPNIVNS